MRRNKYFDWEQAFHFIWENTDGDGIWSGDAASLAKKFDASQNEAESVLEELRDRRGDHKGDDRAVQRAGVRRRHRAP